MVILAPHEAGSPEGVARKVGIAVPWRNSVAAPTAPSATKSNAKSRPALIAWWAVWTTARLACGSLSDSAVLNAVIARIAASSPYVTGIVAALRASLRSRPPGGCRFLAWQLEKRVLEVRRLQLVSGQCARARPAAMITTSSTVCSTSDSRWLEISTVLPSRRSRAGASRSQRMPSGSRPLAGSSRTADAGRPSSAPARPRRWRMPSEKPPTRRSAASARPTSRAPRRPAPRDAGGRRDDAQWLARRAPRVEGGRLQHRADGAGGSSSSA